MTTTAPSTRSARQTHRRAARRVSAVKVLASVALVGGAASVAGLGTFGSFTSTTSASEAVATGKVTIGLTAQATRGLDIAATNLVPGDTVQRAVALTRAADSERFGSVRLTTAGATANLLTGDATNGLQLSIDQCSVAWVKSATSDELTCSGTTTSVVAPRAVVANAVDLGPATAALNGASVANLRVQLVLPTAADNTFQGLANTITFTFDATQRSAEFR